MMRRSRAMLCAIGLALACAAPGCATGQTIPETPVLLETAEQDVYAASFKALGILEASLIVANEAGDLYLISNRLVPADVDRQIRAGFIRVANVIETAAVRINTAATMAWPELRAIVGPVLDAVTRLVDLSRQVSADAGTGDVPAWRRVLQALLGAATGLRDLAPT